MKRIKYSDKEEQSNIEGILEELEQLGRSREDVLDTGLQRVPPEDGPTGLVPPPRGTSQISVLEQFGALYYAYLTPEGRSVVKKIIRLMEGRYPSYLEEQTNYIIGLVGRSQCNRDALGELGRFTGRPISRELESLVLELRQRLKDIERESTSGSTPI